MKTKEVETLSTLLRGQMEEASKAQTSVNTYQRLVRAETLRLTSARSALRETAVQLQVLINEVLGETSNDETPAHVAPDHARAIMLREEETV